MPEAPLWRRAFDAVEHEVAPRLESLVRTSEFARAAALAARLQRLARQQAVGVSARVWHLVNLPAGTDLDRLRAQVGALDREVRRLTLRLEQERAHHRHEQGPEEDPDARGTEPARPAGARAPRRRAQRPADP